MNGKRMRGAHLRQIIDSAGGIIPFEHAMGVSHQAIYQWIKRGHVPLARAIEIRDRYGIDLAELIDPQTLDLIRSCREGGC